MVLNATILSLLMSLFGVSASYGKECAPLHGITKRLSQKARNRGAVSSLQFTIPADMACRADIYVVMMKANHAGVHGALQCQDLDRPQETYTFIQRFKHKHEVWGGFLPIHTNLACEWYPTNGNIVGAEIWVYPMSYKLDSDDVEL